MGPSYLVSCVYRCTLGQEIVGHDPRLLENIPSGDVTCVFAFATTGQTFNKIEVFSGQRYLYYFSKRQCRYAGHIVTFLSKNTSVDKESLPKFPLFDVWRPTPSTDTILQCFLYIFKENEQFFRQHMSEKKAKVWISTDHTFKVAANVGCNLPDGSWGTQFDSLFIVLNKKGQN